jgi:ABC transporter, phosphonate, periplasmic substrate-binding protein
MTHSKDRMDRTTKQMNFPVIRTLIGLFFVCSMQVLTAIDPPADETALVVVPLPAGESRPITLRIGLNDIYCTKTACDCIEEISGRSYDGVVAELKKSDISLEITYFMEVMDLDKAIVAKDFDGFICKPWTALRHMPGTGRNFKRVADVLDPDNEGGLRGLFVTTTGSPVKRLADIHGKRVVFGQEDAYEKYHAALLMLAKQGIKPAAARYFSSCGENLDALMSGSADVAVISNYALTASCAVDFAKPEDFRTIASTPIMPLTSLLLDLHRVSATTATRVQNALLAVSGERTPKDFLGNGFVAPVPWQPVAVSAPTPQDENTAKPPR